MKGYNILHDMTSINLKHLQNVYRRVEQVMESFLGNFEEEKLMNQTSLFSLNNNFIELMI